MGRDWKPFLHARLPALNDNLTSLDVVRKFPTAFGRGVLSAEAAMERNSPIRLAFLLVLLPVFSCFITGSSGTVMAQRASTGGSLQLVDATGNPAGECPLKHTQVKAEISGFLSRVTVTQLFENTLRDKIAAVYTFPLRAGRAVYDMTIVVGNRTIKGKIMRREETQATYAAARA